MPIGAGKGFKLTGAIAFDAGYVTGASDSSVTPLSLGLPLNSASNDAKLKAAAEACLDGANPSPPATSACFTAGLATAALRKKR